MQIYDGSNDKKVIPTSHTVAVVSTNRIVCGINDVMTIRKNGREDWSLFYCEAGRIYCDDKILEKGQVWIYPPEIPQKYTICSSDKTIYRYLHFTGSDVAKMFSSLGIQLMTPIEIKSGLILNTFDNIQKNMNDDSSLSELQAEYHTIYLISQIAKRKKQRSEISMMKSVTDNMEHSFALEYNANYFADMLNISVSRFNHLFRECVGQSPYAYYLNLRIENAVNLLENTEIKIKEIAEKCGFEDPLYFAQVFKRIKGLTPSEYRKLNRIK